MYCFYLPFQIKTKTCQYMHFNRLKTGLYISYNEKWVSKFINLFWDRKSIQDSLWGLRSKEYMMFPLKSTRTADLYSLHVLSKSTQRLIESYQDGNLYEILYLPRIQAGFLSNIKVFVFMKFFQLLFSM